MVNNNISLNIWPDCQKREMISLHTKEIKIVNYHLRHSDGPLGNERNLKNTFRELLTHFLN